MKFIWRYIKAAIFSFQGLKYLWHKEKKTRLLMTLWAALFLIGIFVPYLNKIELAILVFSLAMATVAEIMNTALEITLDMIVGDKFHPSVKAAKDVSASAVFLTVLNFVLMVIIIFGTNVVRDLTGLG